MLIWFSAFGGTALHQFLTTGYTGVTEIVEAYKPEMALFKMFEGLPWTMLLSCVGMTLTIIFFVTSSDSGSLIIDIIAAGGKVDAPIPQRVFWCTAEGLVAIALLLGGGLKSLQAASLATDSPSLLCCWVWGSASGSGFVRKHVNLNSNWLSAVDSRKNGCRQSVKRF